MIEPDSSQRCVVTTHVNKDKLQHRKFCLDIRKKIILSEGGQILKQVLWDLCLWRYWKLEWTQPWEIWSYHEAGPAVDRVWSRGYDWPFWHKLPHDCMKLPLKIFQNFLVFPSQVPADPKLVSKYLVIYKRFLFLSGFLLQILSFHGVLKQGIQHLKCTLCEEPCYVSF